MKKASIRQVQHHLSEVLRWVQDGQEVHITRRNRVVARIVPLTSPGSPKEWPDFVARARAIWGEKVSGESVSHSIISDREERV